MDFSPAAGCQSADSIIRIADMSQTISLFLIVMFSVFAMPLTTAPVYAHSEPVYALSYVNLERYLGHWYEIASIPQRFTRGCTATTADYRMADHGTIEVINKCRRQTLDGPLTEIKGRAWVADPKTDAILAVQFFWPFVGDYWILDLGNNYQWSLVGSPDRQSLWILSREPRMELSVLLRVMESARNQGFDVSRLVMTPQP